MTSKAEFTVELLHPIKVYADYNASADDILQIAHTHIDPWADLHITDVKEEEDD